MSNFPFPKPRIPSIFEDRIPFILRQFVDPCDAPITVWIDAMWPALVHALIAWFQVDLVQIFRTMWRPPLYGLRYRGLGHGSRPDHGGKKKFGRRFKDIITFDYNDWIGKEINPFAEYEMVELLPGEVWFWTGLDVIFTVAFYWAVFDIGTSFLYEWTSGVSMTKYCHARDDAVLLAGAPGYPLLGIFGWDVMGILDPFKMRHIYYFNGFGVAQDVGPGVVGSSFSYAELDGFPDAWIETRMSCLTGPRTGSYAARRVDQGAYASGDAGATYDVAVNEVWVAEIRVNGRWQISDPRLFLHARGTA